MGFFAFLGIIGIAVIVSCIAGVIVGICEVGEAQKEDFY